MPAPAWRGALIFPFLARIHPLDLAGTAASPGPGIPSGFDPHFRVPVRVPNGTQQGQSARRELPPVELTCQVEDEAWESLQMMRSGNSPNTRVLLVFHFEELEYLGHVDAATGDALMPRVGDRLGAILRHPDGLLVQEMAEKPGIYCTQAQPRSHGPGGHRNLLVCTFEARDTSLRGS